jgi:mannitol-1-phosphate 5-dehydrogenase
MTHRTIVIWGAGKIGRGFVADLFFEAGYDLVLVDQSTDLIAQLGQAGRYTVVRAESPEQRKDVVIEGYTALSTDQADALAAAITTTDLIAVAVFPQDFASLARELADGLVVRHQTRRAAPLDILLCTNLAHAGPQFRALLEAAMPEEARDYMQSQLGIVETLVIRMVTEPPAELHRREPLLVWTNGYPELPVDRHAFKGAIPSVPGLRLVEDMRAEETRKLYTYNTFQAALAYLGAREGYRLAVDSLADSEVRAQAEAALGEASHALQAEYGFSADEMARWVSAVLKQTNNPLLADSLERLGADPRRKLRREDRLIGPALLARQHGIQPRYLVRAAAAGLQFDNPAGPGVGFVQERIATLGLAGAVRELCGLTGAEEDLVEAIVQAYGRLQEEENWARAAQRAYELGFEYEKIYHGCGQCALAAVLESLKSLSLDLPVQDTDGAKSGVVARLSSARYEAVFEAATGLAGGIGLSGDATCSAFTAAVLAFGMVYPRRRDHFDGDRENKYRTYAMVERLRERYLERYGSLTCHDIHCHELGRAFDLRDPAEREAFEAAGAHEDKCTGVVAQAAQWAVEIIGQEMIEEALPSQHIIDT